MMFYQKAVNIGFNTQPPEGGWFAHQARADARE